MHVAVKAVRPGEVHGGIFNVSQPPVSYFYVSLLCQTKKTMSMRCLARSRLLPETQ